MPGSRFWRILPLTTLGLVKKHARVTKGNEHAGFICFGPIMGLRNKYWRPIKVSYTSANRTLLQTWNFAGESVVERGGGDGDNKELLRVHDGNGLWCIRCAELQRSRCKEADEHCSRHRRAHRKELSETQEGRCCLIYWSRFCRSQSVSFCIIS